ncbi:MAG: FAD-dependent oxidoreductase [Caulobacteraceae bacterium]|nr:FAD-dependent oxidoreductase [Caulobacteraceae bacterium]
MAETRREQVFPVLTAAQIAIARRFALGPPQRFEPGARMFSVGQRGAPTFLVLAGGIEAWGRDGVGHETLITTHHAGQITGEVNQLAGRAALAEGRAGPEGCEALAFDAPHLRALMVATAEVGEIIMRAFILRRTAMLSDGGVGSVLVGQRGGQALVRIEQFLTRNGYPYTVLDAREDDDGQMLMERLGLHDEDLPIVLCPNGSVLRRPTETEVAACVGITPDLDPDQVFDVAVVGAGPAGLATAVYAASEGLSVLVLDAHAFGGQAGASSRIENYLGFPTGISGHALSARAFNQAQKFGAQVAIPVEVEALECGGRDRRPSDLFKLNLAGERQAKARSVVIASGARYRRPAIENLTMFEGAGVSYWASPVEARLCEGEEVALVGGGNSAGQAVVFLASKVRRLHLVIRREGLEATMSRYLIDRIAALPNVVLHPRSEVTALFGDAETGLQRASFRNHAAGTIWTGPLKHLFLFIGADPNTGWLRDCGVAVDNGGFVQTGSAAGEEPWPAFGRGPLALETSVPGVFAIGDVRAGSTKRVAAAVGEGAQVVAALHGVLAEV